MKLVSVTASHHPLHLNNQWRRSQYGAFYSQSLHPHLFLSFMSYLYGPYLISNSSHTSQWPQSQISLSEWNEMIIFPPQLNIPWRRSLSSIRYRLYLCTAPITTLSWTACNKKGHPKPIYPIPPSSTIANLNLSQKIIHDNLDQSISIPTWDPTYLKPWYNRKTQPHKKYRDLYSVNSDSSFPYASATIKFPSSYNYYSYPAFFALTWDSPIPKANNFAFCIEPPPGKSLEVILKFLMELHHHHLCCLGFVFSGWLLLVSDFYLSTYVCVKWSPRCVIWMNYEAVGFQPHSGINTALDSVAYCYVPITLPHMLL